jgi:hypothetical protein
VIENLNLDVEIISPTGRFQQIALLVEGFQTTIQAYIRRDLPWGKINGGSNKTGCRKISKKKKIV